MSVTIIYATIILVALGALIGPPMWVAKRHPQRKPEIWIASSTALGATFAGAFLGSSLATWEGERATKANLEQVVRSAHAEIETNLPKVEGMVEHGRPSGNDPKRLVLERPAGGLNVLVSMPAFMQYGAPEIVPELLRLNTKLWYITPNAEAGGTYYPEHLYTADPESVLEDLRRARELLRAQIELLE